jgi:DNA mismatch repair protein MutS2
VPPTLKDFSAGALEWPRVREELEAHVYSSLGRRALTELAPRDEDGARSQLARVGELLALPASTLVPFGGLVDPLRALGAARDFGRALDTDELCEIGGFVRARTALGVWVAGNAERMPACAELGRALPPLWGLAEELDRVIDQRGEVLDDASAQLGVLRREITALGRRVESTVRQIAGRGDLQKVIAQGHHGKVHRRAGRPVIAVKARSLGQVPGLVHDRSQSGETAFVEPREVVEDGNRLAGLRTDETREVTRLLAGLPRTVLEWEPRIARAAELLAELELAWPRTGWS